MTATGAPHAGGARRPRRGAGRARGRRSRRASSRAGASPSASRGGSPAPATLVQEAYEVEAASDAAFSAPMASTGVVEAADQVGVAAPGRRSAAARSRLPAGAHPHRRGLVARGPSRSASRPGCWTRPTGCARPITLPDDPGADAPGTRRPAPAGSTSDAAPASARLHVTSLGLHTCGSTGGPCRRTCWRRAGPPTATGCSPTRTTSRPCSGPGENVIAAALGDGWYRGRLGFKPGKDRCTYGTEIGLIAQLEVTRRRRARQLIATDGDWRASTGEIRSADLYDGASSTCARRQAGWDAPGFDASALGAGARSSTFDCRRSSPGSAPPVRVVAVLPATRRRERTGRDAARRRPEHRRATCGSGSAAPRDGGRASATPRCSSRTGRSTSGRSGAPRRPTRTSWPTTRRSCSSRRSRSTASATPRSRRTPSSWTPRSSRSAATRRRGPPSSAPTPRLNRLHENVVWSQRDNFVSVPTDCPQRDERLGWTGDAQAFAADRLDAVRRRGVLARAGCATSRWSRTRARRPERGPGRRCSRGRSGWAGRAGPTPRRSSRGRSTSPTATRACSRRQLASMRAWVDSLVAPARRRRPARPVAAVRGLAGPGRAGRPAVGGEGRLRAPRERVLRPERPAARPTRRGCSATRRPAGTRRSRTTSPARTWAALARTTRSRRRPGARRCCASASRRPRTRAAVGRGAGARSSARRTAGSRRASSGRRWCCPRSSDTGHLDEAYRMLLRRERRRGCTRSTRARRRSGSAGTRSCPTARSTRARCARSSGETRARRATCCRSTTTPTARSSTGCIATWPGSRPPSRRPGYRRVVVAPRPVRAIRLGACGDRDGLRPRGDRLAAGPGGSCAIELALPFGVTARLDLPMTGASTVSVDGGPRRRPGARLAPGHHAIEARGPRCRRSPARRCSPG